VIFVQSQALICDKHNVGPYKADGSDYWIPGFQGHVASHPIPADKAQNVPVTADLFFRHGFKAKDHHVWLAVEGEEPTRVTVGGIGNLAAVADLRPHTTYHWKVVTEHDSHDMHGPTWTFTTGGVETSLVVV